MLSWASAGRKTPAPPPSGSPSLTPTPPRSPCPQVRAKNLFSVAGLRMYWHPQGDYLAVQASVCVWLGVGSGGGQRTSVPLSHARTHTLTRAPSPLS